MTIRTIAEAFALRVLCSERNLEREVCGGYASDMLSCVMAGAKPGNLWLTLLTHLNVIAVAVLLEIPAVLITEDAPVDPAVLQKADAEGIVVLQTPETTYRMAGKLYGFGLR